MNYELFLYLLIMVIVTNAIRVIPVVVLRRPIKNLFVRSFLYYVPYVTLAVMTFPAIMQATENPLAGFSALIIGCLAAWLGLGLFPVSIVCCGVVLCFHFFV